MLVEHQYSFLTSFINFILINMYNHAIVPLGLQMLMVGLFVLQLAFLETCSLL